MNVSVPKPLRDYVEAQASKGSYSTSEYVRQLIRDDKKRREQEERDLLWELLAAGAKQIEEGDTVEIDAAGVLARGRARRAAAAN